MATENILIKFTADLSGIKSSIEEMQKLGKVTEEDKKKFDTLLGTVEGIDDALREVGIEAGKTAKEFTKASDSGKSLRTQLAEAKNEAVRLSQAFGPFSKEAQNAAKKAALIKDEISDLNDTLDALNPEAKLNAFVKLGQGIQGGFQAATGALQVFGVENEKITKLAQQFQGVLNLTQGINSVLQLKDVYGQLRLVLGLTTTAQQGLNAAQAANPLGAILLTLTLVIGAIVTYTSVTKDSTKAVKAATEEEKALYEAQLKRVQSINELIRSNTKTKELLAIDLKEARGEITKFAADIQRLAIEERKAIEEVYKQPITGFTPFIVKQIKESYAIRRQILEVEAEKEKKTVQDRIVSSYSSLELKNNLDAAIAQLNEFIQKQLDDLEPVKVKVGFTVPEIGAATKLNQELFRRTDEARAQELNNLAAYANSAKEITQGIYDLNFALIDRDIALLQEKKDKGIITEQQYQQELKAIKNKAAEDQKKAAVFGAILGAAGAIINALNTVPATAAPAAVALASITSALNLARILATPVPKFKKGTLNVGGGTLDADGGMHAIIHKGEAVIPSQVNKEYHPTIKALFNRQVKASDINSFVQMKLNGKIPNSIDAKIDHNKLGKMMSKKGIVDIANGNDIAKLLASAIDNKTNRRQW